MTVFNVSFMLQLSGILYLLFSFLYFRMTLCSHINCGYEACHVITVIFYANRRLSMKRKMSKLYNKTITATKSVNNRKTFFFF